MKKVLITGESGNIGRLLVAEFRSYGYEVINDSVNEEFKKFNKISVPLVFNYDYKDEIDFTNYHDMEHIISKNKPDIVIHTAAYVGTDKCESNSENALFSNVVNVYSITEILNRYVPNCLFVNFGTTATMDPKKYTIGNPITEKTERKPMTWYGDTKLMGEMVVKRFMKNWINFLPVFLFGEYPHDTSSVWNKVFVSSLQGKKYDIKLNTSIFKQYEYVENIIPIVRKIIENKKAVNQDIVITGSEYRKFNYFLEIAKDSFQSHFDKKLLYKLSPKEDYLGNHVADNSSMLKYAKISKEDFERTRVDFRSAINMVLESVSDSYEH
jgi:dTDP-4-dehydrorhamnose reductase